MLWDIPLHSAAMHLVVTVKVVATPYMVMSFSIVFSLVFLSSACNFFELVVALRHPSDSSTSFVFVAVLVIVEEDLGVLGVFLAKNRFVVVVFWSCTRSIELLLFKGAKAAAVGELPMSIKHELRFAAHTTSFSKREKNLSYTDI